MLTDNRGAPRGNQNDIESTVWAAFEKQMLPFFKGFCGGAGVRTELNPPPKCLEIGVINSRVDIVR